MGAAEDAFNRRLYGQDRTGTVSLRDFDMGVVTSLGAVEQADPKAGQLGMFIPTVIGVCAPDGAPGIPVVFANPEDVIKDYKLPVISVRRDDITPATERKAPSGQQYRAPGEGAVPVTVTKGSQTFSGFDRMEHLPQAEPFDFTYTIAAKARYRGAPGNPSQVNALFQHILRIYPTYGKVVLTDSIGDWRSYEAFMEGIQNIDTVGEVQERVLGFSITLRVEGELDIKDPRTLKTVKVPLTARIKRL